MNIRRLVFSLSLLLGVSVSAQPARRALLIGIDDYTASTLPRAGATTPERERGWPDLKGAANDAAVLAEMLVLLYGFERKNVVVLTNQQATRAAILGAIERHLVAPARKGDVVFYSFAGHGAQVPNAASDEPDRLDESIVPADSRRGAVDIRDKELRPLFNRLLDAGAQLTLLLDHCHSGSGFRANAAARGIGRAAPVVDAKDYGPRPEERGALVLASTQDLDPAWEAPGEDGLMHGAFTWAWLRALRDAARGEPVQETFLRAQARMRAEAADQAPVMLGRAEARLRPFLGSRARRLDRTAIAVEKVTAEGDVILQGGWANGLAVGSELRLLGAGATSARVRVARVLGLGRSIARMQAHRDVPAAVRSGALLEVVIWPAQERPLRIAMPRGLIPTSDGIAVVANAREADYELATRSTAKRTEYSWRRARQVAALPDRTAWTRELMQLRRDLLTLQRIHAWSSLESPLNTPAPYRLAVRHEQTRQLVRGSHIAGGETHSIVLRAPTPAEITRRYYYVFAVDSHGRSQLLFPRSGSVENRFPIGSPAPRYVVLGAASAFRVQPPYGVDTYYLLSTDEPLPNPAILEWEGVRARRALAANHWSIERITFESVAPAPRRASAGRAAARRR
jgi:hypothetical protein